MHTTRLLTPVGPIEKYDPSQDLLQWMTTNVRKCGDIYRASIYGSEVYVISDPKYADHVLRENWQNYRKGQAIKRVAFLLGNGLMASEGEFWKSQRRMIQPAFHQAAICELTSTIVEANRALLTKWSDAAQVGDCVNVTRDTSLLVLEIVLRSIFGSDYESVGQHFSILSSVSTRDMEFAHSFRPLASLVMQVITERRNSNKVSADMLGMLLKACDRQDGSAMTDNQLVTEVMTLIVAGHETTASTLSWVWYLLSQHPEAEHKLSVALCQSQAVEGCPVGQTKCAYALQVIEEAMRLYPPGWLMTRRALKDDQLGDYLVPAGTEIYISPYVIQRHPHLWDNPDRFDPDRFSPENTHGRHPLAMLPFSAGPRKCIGEGLARLEMEIHLVMIARHLRLRFIEGNIELEAGVNLRNKHDFVMAPEIKMTPSSASSQSLSSTMR